MGFDSVDIARLDSIVQGKRTQIPLDAVEYCSVNGSRAAIPDVLAGAAWGSYRPKAVERVSSFGDRRIFANLSRTRDVYSLSNSEERE